MSEPAVKQIQDIISLTNEQSAASKIEGAVHVLVNEGTNPPTSALECIKVLLQYQNAPIREILDKYLSHLILEQGKSNTNLQSLYESLVDLFTPPTAVVALALSRCVTALVTIYESQGEHAKAIEALKLLNNDSIAQEFTDMTHLNEFKFRNNMKLAKNCYALQDYESAENHLTRSVPLLVTLTAGHEDEIQEYNNLSVQVLVSCEKWMDATTKLLALDDPRYDVQTVLFAVLVPASQFKVNLFKSVERSDRVITSVLGTPLGTVYSKMSAKKLVYAPDVTQLLDYLAQLQSPVELNQDLLKSALGVAVVENNLVAASTIFETATLDTFAELLGMDVEVVQNITADMVRSGRLRASVDDIDKVVEFENTKVSALQEWQDHVVGSCTILEKIIDDVAFEKRDVKTA